MICSFLTTLKSIGKTRFGAVAVAVAAAVVAVPDALADVAATIPELAEFSAKLAFCIRVFTRSNG